jgi:hypothetical protein
VDHELVIVCTPAKMFQSVFQKQQTCLRNSESIAKDFDGVAQFFQLAADQGLAVA